VRDDGWPGRVSNNNNNNKKSRDNNTPVPISNAQQRWQQCLHIYNSNNEKLCATCPSASQNVSRWLYVDHLPFICIFFFLCPAVAGSILLGNNTSETSGQYGGPGCVYMYINKYKRIDETLHVLRTAFILILFRPL
jgi:hypothetical protein